MFVPLSPMHEHCAVLLLPSFLSPLQVGYLINYTLSQVSLSLILKEMGEMDAIGEEHWHEVSGANLSPLPPP